MKKSVQRRLKQGGATAVEFALVLLTLLAFVLGVVDLSRMLFTWNAASEATRIGARYAAVCDDATRSAEVLARMQALVPQIQTIAVEWSPPNCTTATCEGVSVRVTGLTYQWISPIAGLSVLPSFSAPGFSTYLPREVMRQDPNGLSDTFCSR